MTTTRISWAVAWSVVAAAAVGCGGGAKPGAGAARGTAGSSFTVTVSNQGAGGGAITSVPSGIACAPETSCSATFAHGTTVVLTAGATSLYFNGWFGGCNDWGRTCTLSGDADKYVVAYFSEKPESHPNLTDPKLHGPAFIGQTLVCTDCHGPRYQGVGIAPSCNDCHAKAGHPNWLTDCTLCHGDPARTPLSIAAAPPRDARGEVASAAVGAHQRHLAGGAVRAAMACTECHAVPDDMAHALRPLALTWGALAGHGGIAPSFDATARTCTNYCHGASMTGGTRISPAWDRGPSQAACGSCHGLPPPAASGHPDLGPSPALSACAWCHPTTRADGTIDVAGGKHVDGKVDLAVDGSAGCAACHGAPPATGSHLAHPFGCGLCHAATTADGTSIADASRHLNGAVDVVPGAGASFAYARAAGGATCANVSCHLGVSATWGATSSGHLATLGAGDVVVFEQANEDHGDDFRMSESCTSCHDANLTTQHAGRCEVCHEGATPVVSLGGAWNKGCSQGACHPTIHAAGPGSDHFGIYRGTSSACVRCHDQNGGFPGSGDNCSWCHAPAFTIAAVGDHAPPTTTTDAAGEYVGYGSIHLTATDAGTAGVSQTWFLLDGTSWELGDTAYFPAPNSGSRVRTLWFYSVDHARNAEAVKSVTFTVRALTADTTPPTTTSSFVPASGASFGAAQPVTLTAVDAGGSGVKATYYRIDSGPLVPGYSFTVTGDGVHTFSWYSADKANNVEAAHVSNPFRIDTVAPGTTCNAVSGATYPGAQTFTLSASDFGGSGVASTWYRVDAGEWTAGTSVAVAPPSSKTAPRTITWYSIDVVGNREATRSVTVILQAPLDTTPPATTSSFTPAPGATFRAAQPVALAATDAGWGVKATYYRIDSGPFVLGTSFTVTGDGLHTFRWYSVDEAGNVEATHSSSQFRIDTVAPVTAASVDDGRSYRGDLAVTLSATDAGSGVASTWRSLDGGAFAPGGSILVPAPATGIASHTLAWYSIDAAGNQEGTRSATFTVSSQLLWVTLSFRTEALFAPNWEWDYVVWEVHDVDGNVVLDADGQPASWWNDDPGDPSSMGHDFVVPAGVAYTMWGAWGPMPDGPDSETATRPVSAAEAAPGTIVTWQWY